MKTFLRQFLASLLVVCLFHIQVTPTGLRLGWDLNAKSLELEEIDGKGSNFTSLIMGIGTGLIAMTLVKRASKPTTDIMLAAGGGVAFLAGEMLSNDKGKEEIDKANTDIEIKDDGTIDGNQLKSLEKLKESYQSVKKSADTKKMLHMASAAALLGAAVMAGMQYMKLKAAKAKCSAGITKAFAELAKTQAGVGGADPTFLTCSTALQQTPLKIEIAEKSAETPGSSTKQTMLLNKEALATVKAGCQGAATPPAIALEQACTPYLKILPNIFFTELNAFPAGAFFTPIKTTPPFEYLLNLLLPTAHAFDTKMLGLGAVAAGALMGFVNKSSTNFVDKFIGHPRNRIILWGAMAAVAGKAVMSSMDESKKAQNNIDKIDEMIEKMKERTEGHTNGGDTGDGGFAEVTGPGSSNLGPLSPMHISGRPVRIVPKGQKIPCLAGTQSDGSCQDYGKTLTNSAQKDFATFSPGVASLISDSAKLGNSLQGSSFLSNGALTAAGSLAGKGASALRLSDKLKLAINKQNKENGESEVPFEKYQDNLLKQLQAQAIGSLQSRGYTPSSGELSAFKTGSGSLNQSSLEKNAAGESKKDGEGVKLGVAAPSGSAIPMGGKGSNGDLDFGFLDEAADGTGASDGIMNSEGLGSEQELAKFESEESSEIINRPGVSLWKVLTIRYLKSAYPKLLESEQNEKQEK